MLLVTAIATLVIFIARVSAVEAQAATGTFAAPPNFGTGTQAAAVFLGGSVDQLEAAARSSATSGVWVQDKSGAFQLLVVGGPAFLRDTFTSKFPGGFASATALTLTRPSGASGTSGTPPPIATSVPSTPPAFPTGVPGPSKND